MKTCIILTVGIGLLFGLLSLPISMLMARAGLARTVTIQTYDDLSEQEQALTSPDDFVPHTRISVNCGPVGMCLAALCALAVLWRRPMVWRLCGAALSAALAYGSGIILTPLIWN